MIDPILGIAFGFVLLWASWGILKDSTHLLMEGTPPEVTLSEIKEVLEGRDGVSDVHHMHAWALTSGRHVFSAHLRVDKNADSQAVLRAAHRILEHEFGFYFSTLQVERGCLDESKPMDIDISIGHGKNVHQK